MKPSSLTVFSIMLLAVASCSPSHPDNEMILPAYKGQPQKYRPASNATNTITAVIKNEAGGEPVSAAIVEIYLENNLSNYLMATTTGHRGKFNFVVKDGVYRLIISHSKYKEKEIFVTVKGFDVDLNEITVSPYTY
ncbi:MAG: hypothetical protein ABIR18_00010 [Chitinophagaceae bacterium]